VGISVDDPIETAKWANEIGVTFPLLSDRDGAITKQFGFFDPQTARSVRALAIVSDGAVVYSEIVSTPEIPARVAPWIENLAEGRADDRSRSRGNQADLVRAFQNLRTVTRTQTNGLLLLDDPKDRTGEFTNAVSVILDGTLEVFTQPPVLSREGLYLLPWWIGEMPSRGTSMDGLEITVSSNPGLVSNGVIRQNVPDQTFPATLEAAVFQVFDVPGYGKLHHKYPVIINGDVNMIPPYHTIAKCSPALLFDEENNIRGMIAGRALTLLGPAE